MSNLIDYNKEKTNVIYPSSDKIRNKWLPNSRNISSSSRLRYNILKAEPLNELYSATNQIAYSKEGEANMSDFLINYLDRLDKDAREREERYHNDSREREDRYYNDAREREQRYRAEMLEQDKKFREELTRIRNEQLERDQQFQEDLKAREERFFKQLENLKNDMKSDVTELKTEVRSSNKHTLAIAVTTVIGIAAMVVAVFIALFKS